MLLLPSPLTSTERNLAHVHTAFWDPLHEYVRVGGLVYASLCADAAIPEMADLFGASLADHASVGEVRLTFVAPYGDISAGATFQYQAEAANPRHWPATLELAGGQVIAIDHDGRPALVAHSYGKGKTLLSAYPLETYLAARPAAFESPEPTHQLYRGLAQSGGLALAFATGDPGVEIAGLTAKGRGYAVLANHRPETRLVTVASRVPFQAVRQITPAGKQPMPGRGSQWQLELPAYGGAVLEYTL